MPRWAAMLTVASYLAECARPTYERIAAWLGRRLGEPAELLTGIGWEERLRRLDDGRVHVGFICGFPYVQRAGRPEPPVEVLCAPIPADPRYGGRPVYFTDVIVRRESPPRTFADLRGRRFAYNDAGSHSGYNVPRDHLLRLGETRGFFGETVASGSHQASIDLVVAGKADASGIDSTVLDLERHRRPELAGALRTIVSLGPEPIPPVVIARGLSASLKRQLLEAFLAMHEDAAGRAILADGLLVCFVPVRDADYDPIRAMVRRAETAGFLEIR
jgi:phosphonate transport system substrate-binding protein